MDVKTKYILAQLSDAFDIDSAACQTAFERFGYVAKVAPFFLASGPSKLVFTLREEYSGSGIPRIDLSVGTFPHGYTGKGYFFLRLGNRNITNSNLESDIASGQLTDGLLLSIFRTFNDVLLPSIRGMESWGRLTDRTQVEDFLGAMRKYVASVSEANEALVDAISIEESELPALKSLPTDIGQLAQRFKANPALQQVSGIYFYRNSV
ncbi:hypothetical protein KIPB_013361 [Kipferlia bialata]|uniref:Uncharacterized protein n=1 Tax=Kipferlia bialata TaxID=797122 RepID=A0A9K3D7Q7_9EUKA|nr:hypothetical protein KIPB_013361 [Kipferlia bialata]|eukprot:g13361.t1